MGLIKRVIKKDMYFGAKEEVFNLALRMRKNPTKAEKAMWNILRKFRERGFVFRRQHPIEFYIADFYCHKLRLVIEVDGEIHSDEEIRAHDEGRTGEMERYGITVLRFTNHQILNEIEFVTNQLETAIQDQPASTPTSSPEGFQVDRPHPRPPLPEGEGAL